MKDLTWPAVVVFVAVLAALVGIFALTDDPSMRAQVLGYFQHIVPFVVGFGGGAALGGAVGFTSGYAKGHANAREELRRLQEIERANGESARQAAQVVRVAAEEGHLAADEAR